MVSFFGLDWLLQSKVYSFSGVELDMAMADSKGWTMILETKYNHVTTHSDFALPMGFQGGSLLTGTCHAGSNTLALAAMGSAQAVTKEAR